MMVQSKFPPFYVLPRVYRRTAIEVGHVSMSICILPSLFYFVTKIGGAFFHQYHCSDPNYAGKAEVKEGLFVAHLSQWQMVSLVQAAILGQDDDDDD